MKKIVTAFLTRMHAIFTHTQCAHTFAKSVCFGVYVAFSPFVGFHTAMVILFSWFFALNFSLTLATSVLINNPWTMIPVYATDHLIGHYLFSLFSIDISRYEPTWVTTCSTYLEPYIGVQSLSLWAFLCGGNLLALCLSCILYPVAKNIGIRYISRSSPNHNTSPS
ncbi:MAG TPA: DUF2062 domain-containing protein [Candidatus Bathyarchaeia archaeon]|nr:DUF2062 domain-containing protein [Candidatus Bathyarchaeia archaeon]